MTHEVPYISHAVRDGPSMGRVNLRIQAFSFDGCDSPMETEILVPKAPSFEIAMNPWARAVFEDEMSDAYAKPQAQSGSQSSECFSTMLQRLSLTRRQSVQLASMDLDNPNTPFEADSVVPSMDTSNSAMGSSTSVDGEYPPTPPLTPPSLQQSPSSSPGSQHTPGSMARLRSIAPKAIRTSYEEPFFSTPSSMGEDGGYAPRIRCVSLPVVSPMSGIQID